MAGLRYLMLTGFLLTTATVRHFRRTGQLDWGPFFARRLLRVWPVLVATTLLLYALGFPPGCEPSRFGFWSNWLLIANFAGDSCKASRAPRARAAAGTAPSATHAVASAVNTHTHTHTHTKESRDIGARLLCRHGAEDSVGANRWSRVERRAPLSTAMGEGGVKPTPRRSQGRRL